MNETLGPSWADLVAARAEEQATLTNQRENLIALLTARFGPIPATVRQQITVCLDMKRLRTAFRRAVHLHSLDQFQL